MSLKAWLPGLALLLAAPMAAHAESAQLYPIPSGEVGCSHLVESFCDALWAPDTLGNLNLPTTSEPRLGQIALGRTPSETNYLYDLFSQAKLAARGRLPKDLAQRLNARGYFEKLTKLLAHKPYAQMTEKEVEEVRALFTNIDAIWQDTIQDTASARVSKVHAGFFRLTDERIPTWISHAYSRTRDELEASIWTAIWSEHPRWKLIERAFADLKEVFLELIQKHPGISEEVRKLWADRIRTTTLVIPGSSPIRLSDTERRCATTDLNGYHWAEHNAVVICGGYILQGDPLRTLAHELAHSLGQYRAEQESSLRLPLADRLTKLREQTCIRQPYPAPASESPPSPLAALKKGYSCTEWKQWKAGYQADLLTAHLTNEQNKDFLACFQTKKLKGKPSKETVDYIAREWVQSEIEAQARRDRIIRMTKETEILRNGAVHPNPSYLDPCGVFYLYDGKDPYGAEFTVNLFFVNEYRCQIESTPDHCKDKPELCLKNAIEGAQSLEFDLRRMGIDIQTPYSSVRELQRQGYAEDIEEDLADHLGQLAFAKYLEKLKDPVERRAHFLATVSSLCDEPSIAKLYPAEAQVQKEYYIDAHSEGLDRRRKLLIDPIRRVLGCKKDFEEHLKACDWYHPK